MFKNDKAKKELKADIEIDLTDGAQLEIAAANVKNKMSLTDLITQKPTEHNYQEIIELLTQLAKSTYEQYKFFIARSHDETKEPNFLQIVSHSSEMPHLHKLIFSKSVEYGIDMQVLQKKFAEYVSQNNVIDIGDSAIVITDDGSLQLPTGVSPINSGLEGGEIAFIISFIHKDNYGEWYKNTFPEKEEDNE